ncbi:MAG: excinuclease ABC subunit UvrC [Clostridia bacterium]|nr:excinuclease ABC subunit UvrC [Clostridia bacterium]
MLTEGVESMTVLERLRDKANSLPLSAGVYIMKNADGEIIYVGKSKKLKNRVSSYFTTTHTSYKTARMVSLVRDFDYIVCDTEIEALALENTLIKKHSPRYNIKLKDAKSYPYIKVTGEEYPRLIVTRDRKSDKGRYFGPYQGAAQAHAALDAVVKIFGLYTCKRQFPRDIGKERPCIYKDMGRCVSPCAGGVDPEEYRALVKQAEWVLDGNIKTTLDTLRRDMEEAAEEMEFERAAQLRDSIRAIEALRQKQKVVADTKVMRDVFAIHTSDTEGVLAMLSIRGGALINKNEFILSSSELSDAEDAVSLIANYYDTAGNIPREVMLDFALEREDIELLSEYLSLMAPYKVSVRVPERGEGRKLCDMALENARESAKQHRLEGEREGKSVSRLAELLGLSETPRRIEAYDISNWGNESIVASMVVWESGKLKKSDYRSFTIRTTGGADDYGSMREALSRRLAHIGDGTPSLGEMPDLILLDGGVGQVHAVREVLSELSLEIPLFGMVKDDYHKTRAITDGETEISIAQEMNVYTFVYNLQEETHRFAIKHSTGQKRKTLTRSSLEKIEGIGPKKAKLLLKAMPLGKIRESSVEELRAVKGISAKDAESIYSYYHKR